MIGCDFCDEWYHYNCLNLTKAEAKELTKKEWTCPNCEFKSSGIQIGVSRGRFHELIHALCRTISIGQTNGIL